MNSETRTRLLTVDEGRRDRFGRAGSHGRSARLGREARPARGRPLRRLLLRRPPRPPRGGVSEAPPGRRHDHPGQSGSPPAHSYAPRQPARRQAAIAVVRFCASARAPMALRGCLKATSLLSARVSGTSSPRGWNLLWRASTACDDRSPPPRDTGARRVGGDSGLNGAACVAPWRGWVSAGGTSRPTTELARGSSARAAPTLIRRRSLVVIPCEGGSAPTSVFQHWMQRLRAEQSQPVATASAPAPPRHFRGLEQSAISVTGCSSTSPAWRR
jgi:hypothetical protein